MNQYIDLGMMTTTSFWSPPDIALNYKNLPNTVTNTSPQIPILHTNREQHVLIG
jgi:hypothetical protein